MRTIESISAEILPCPPSFESACSSLFSSQLSFEIDFSLNFNFKAEIIPDNSGLDLDILPDKLKFNFDVLPKDFLVETEVIEQVCGNARHAQCIALGIEIPEEVISTARATRPTAIDAETPSAKTWSGTVCPPLASAHPTPVRRGRRRIHAELPALGSNDPPVSVYQRLKDYGLLRKITDIVLAKTSMPWNLREDAAQEVHLTWLGLQVKPQFVRNQVAKYAYMAGQHAALKLRRSIGAVVSIPGVLFRADTNHPFMESIGAAVNPQDIDEYHNNLELSLDHKAFEESYINDDFFENRMRYIDLTEQQRRVARCILVQRQDAEELAEDMGETLGVIERLVGQVIKKLHAFDAAVANGEFVLPPDIDVAHPEVDFSDERLKSLCADDFQFSLLNDEMKTPTDTGKTTTYPEASCIGVKHRSYAGRSTQQTLPSRRGISTLKKSSPGLRADSAFEGWDD